MTTMDELIVRLMPFSKQLKEQCKKDIEFSKALKVNNYKRFVSLGAVMISRSPLVPEDEIIGVYTYDYRSKTPKFKQDFIVNIGKKDKKFILYTRCPGGSKSKRVKDINEFFSKYSKGRYYTESHHLKYDDLPDMLKPRALWAVELAKKLQQGGSRKLTNKELDKFDRNLKKLGV